jgi:alpha-L-rhamnosidase
MLAGSAFAQTGMLNPVDLRCENLANPLGIDQPAPRLSWRVESAQRAQVQTAYRILVTAGDAQLWDTGKVASDATTAIVYQGKPLASLARVSWKVQVWDKAGNPSNWSQPATWSLGLLDPAEWKAQWIGYDKFRQTDAPDADFTGAKWITFANDKPMNAPNGFRVFMTSFTLPPDAKVERADLLVTGDDKCWFVINGQQVSLTQAYNQPAGLDVAAHVKPGENFIRAQVENTSAGPTGLLAKLTIKTADNKTTTIVTDASWRATDAPGANWHNRAIDANAWPAAKEIANYGAQPWGKLKFSSLTLPPPSYLRITFKADKPIRRATVYATALGIFDLYLNGQRVTEDFFNPGWTDYTKRVYYRAYDVTDRLKTGDNAIGVILADGWYSGYVGYGKKRDHYGKQPRLRAQLHIEYQDGTTALVATGPDWKASAAGPIREADFLMGETVDARTNFDDFSQPAFDASRWDAVNTGAEMNPLIQHHPGPPVVAIAEFKPKTITEPTPGVYVLNLAQNFAGVYRLALSNTTPGQKITLRFAERLNPDGTVYTTNLREARVTDTYTCRGGAHETYQPRFTFHGYQYVEITGLAAKPSPDVFTGVALSSDTPVAGTFECSDPMINQLHSNIYWTQRMNFIDIPTDCPQRDERLGWTGDAQVYVRTATLNTDVHAFFTKWLVDLEDGQRTDGQFPMVAPVKVAGDDGGPAWADAGVICPWTIYETYGDTAVLAQHYDSMKRFIAFCEKRSTKDLLPPKTYHCFGDWLSIKADTPKDIIYTAYFARSTKLTAQAAEVLGKTDDAKKYNALFERIKAAFNNAYVKPDGRITGNTQTCYVLAVAFDLLDDEKTKLAAKYLVEDIESRDNHLSTGFIGTKDLMLALAKVGRNDVAYRLLHQETFPSWGFSIRHGATSIWERWNGWTPEEGFFDPSMNSFAHYSFGAVYQWMVENIGGIRSEAGAYKKILIAPHPGGKLTWAKVSYTSIHGPIESAWKLDNGKLQVDVTIPANTTATIQLPSSPPQDIGSGTYHFTAEMKN